jgi:AraC-like DNA-binding protein
VRELARATGLSERQLYRRCLAAFGYGPAVLARILRLQRALQLALAHEVRAIMGTTPTRLLRSR